MQSPKPHIHEAKRMQALRELDLLDTPPEPRFDRIARLAAQIMGTSIAAVTLVDGQRQWFKAITGLDVAQTPRRVSFCGHVINQTDIFVVSDARLDPRFADNPLVTADPQIGFYIGVPVHSHSGLPVGTLCAIDRKPREPSAAQMAALRDLAAILEDELRLRTAAGSDSLTGLNNRRAFLPHVEREVARARRGGPPFALIALDMDGLKPINDRHGHAAGDAALRQIAQVLTEQARRPTDVLARFGGDEFAMLLGGCDPTSARRRAEAVLRAVNHLASPSGEPLSVSLGVACAVNPQRVPKLDRLLRLADRKLYEAKNAARGSCSLTIIGDRRGGFADSAYRGQRRRCSDSPAGQLRDAGAA